LLDRPRIPNSTTGASMPSSRAPRYKRLAPLLGERLDADLNCIWTPRKTMARSGLA
jgi:hypothetical protein